MTDSSGQILRKVFEDAEIEVYRIELKSYDRRSVASALGRNIMDPFNIVNEVSVKYYSEHLPYHRVVLKMAARYGLPIVILWKKPPGARIHPDT